MVDTSTLPLNVTVLSAHDRRKVGLIRCLIDLVKNLIRSRELVAVLFHRDFFAVYKKSFLGIAWLVITPLLGVVSWVFMYFTGILHPGNLSIPYPAYVLLSTSIWALFVGFYTGAADTLTSGAGFIMQVKYPHEVLLVKQVAQHLAISLINFLITFAVLMLFGVFPHWNVVFAIVLALPLLLLGTGVGLVISVLGVVLLEARKGMDIIMGLLIWVTPVIYSTNFSSPLLQKFMLYNPLTYLVGGLRDFVIYGQMENWDRYLISAGFAFLTFVFSWRLFFLSEEHVIEKML